MIKKCHYLKKTDNGQQIFLKGFYDNNKTDYLTEKQNFCEMVHEVYFYLYLLR